ncbi:hypothetical protein CHUAL_005992 [Chamberlinius hualienensis]
MSLFGDFQDAWSKRFPGCELPQAWEDDVRANLHTHRRRLALLREEIEKEEFYVEYLERLLAEVERHRRSLLSQTEDESESPSPSNEYLGQAANAQHGSPNNKQTENRLKDIHQQIQQLLLPNGIPFDLIGENKKTLDNKQSNDDVVINDDDEEEDSNQFVTVIQVNVNDKLNSNVTDGDVEDCSKSDSSSSSPYVTKKIPPKPPPKKPKPANLTYKGSLKDKDLIQQDGLSSARSKIQSLPPQPIKLNDKKTLSKSDSIKSTSSLDDYEELQNIFQPKKLKNADNFMNLDHLTTQSDDGRVSSRLEAESTGQLVNSEDENDDNSPKYSDYVNIDYFLKKRAAKLRCSSGGSGGVGGGVDDDEEEEDEDDDDDDDDGMGLLLHTLVNSTEDEEEAVTGGNRSDIDTPAAADRILQQPTVNLAGVETNSNVAAAISNTHTNEEQENDSGVYSSSVESASFLCSSAPPTPPQQGPSGVTSSSEVAAEAERITMVKCIVNSIFESESIYWECLNVLLQYMKALRSTLDTSQPVIPREDLNVIFYKIPELHSLHSSFLEGIKSTVVQGDGRLLIGDHFKQLASRLGVYAAYLQNYSHAIDTVRKCSAEHPKFGDVTKSIKLQALKGQTVSLEDLLHKPVARVQKNALVLHDLLKYTSEYNPDYKSLQTALRMTQCFLNEFNMSATESMFPAHDRTQRHLVKNSFIVELSEGRRKLRHLFLFNDVIVCAKYKVSGREKFTYEVKWYIPLHDVILPVEDGFVREINPVNLLTLRSQVASIRDLITKEELSSKEQKSWGSGRNLDKLKKRLAELQAQIMLASPNLVFRLAHKSNHRNLYFFFLSSKFERCQWIEAITAVQASAPQIPTSLTLYELQAWITACHRFLQTNMGSFLLKSGKEDELLVGDLNVIVNSMQGLQKPSDIYLCLEVDSYGHYFRKAITDVCRLTIEPEWKQEFVIDLEGSQMLRILCYEEVAGHEPLIRGKAAIELNKSWLTNQLQEKKISIQDCTLSLSLRFTQRERTLSRVPSSKSCAVFGLKIGQVVKREKREIPFLISCCLREVEKRGMHELGVYRVCGPASELQRLKRAFETNPYDAEQMVKEVDIHSVTGVLKLYLRELPEGLFTDELYPKFIEAFSLSDGEAKSKSLLSLYNSLPKPNNVIANYLIEHMIRINREEVHNKMSIQNVATVFGPTLLRPSVKSESGNLSDKLAAGTIDVMAQAGILYFYLKRRAAGENLLVINSSSSSTDNT